MSREGKHMDKVMKIVLMAVGAGTVIVAVTVMGLMGMKKDADVSKVASSGQIIEMQENQSEKTSISKDELKSEASELYVVHKDELVCSLEEFEADYIKYREQGISKEKALDTLSNSYKKEFQQVETNEAGEVVASGFNADTVIDEPEEPTTQEQPTQAEQPTQVPQAEEPTTQVQQAYVVESLAPVTMYASQAVNLRQGPSAADFEKVGALSQGQSVNVVGIVKVYNGATTLWYQLDNGNFASGAYLTEQMPVAQVEPQTSAPSQSTQTQSEPSEPESNKAVFNGDGTVTFNGVTLKLGSDIETEPLIWDTSELPTGNFIE